MEKKAALDVDVAIVGGGFAGICTAIQLKKKGLSFVVLERESSPGGTWFANKYPGCACDVPMLFYCFSFDLYTNKEVYLGAPGILNYALQCCRKHGIFPFFRLNTSVQEARYNESDGMWTTHATTTDGHTRHPLTVRSQFLVSATGLLNVPLFPPIRGLEGLEHGKCNVKIPVVHSARWDTHVEVEGKKVGVIGNGSSAVQIVESVAPKAAHLYLLQRSPKWLLRKAVEHIHPTLLWLFSCFPALLYLVRCAVFLTMDALEWVVTSRTWVSRKLRSRMLHEMLDEFPNAAKENLIPEFSPGCSRVIVHTGYLRALNRPNASLLNVKIGGVNPDGTVVYVGTDGKQGSVKLDVLILATGFKINNCLPQFRIVGRGGVTLADAWEECPRAYLGLAVAKFPNMFVLYGPNTNTVVGSITFFTECAVAYAIQCIEWVRARRAKALEVRQEVVDKYNGRVETLMKRRPEAEGCSAWYKGPGSKLKTSPTNFPGTMTWYWWLTRRVCKRDFSLVE